MVTDAIAEDINSDGWVDLILVGEWMPIQIYYNNQGVFQLDESDNGLLKTHGWWNCITTADFDKDGDMDFIAGNWGLNNPFKASINEPISIYAKDYDENGTQEAILTYYNQGQEFIFHPRGTLTKQIPGLKNIFPDYQSYGKATFSSTFKSFNFKPSEIFSAYELASIYIENMGMVHLNIEHYKALFNGLQLWPSKWRILIKTNIWMCYWLEIIVILKFLVVGTMLAKDTPY